MSNTLESEEQQEGHHKTEQTHSFRQGEPQDSVWEQLLFQRWISGVTDDEGTEHRSDTSTCLYWKFSQKKEKNGNNLNQYVIGSERKLLKSRISVVSFMDSQSQISLNWVLHKMQQAHRTKIAGHKGFQWILY